MAAKATRAEVARQTVEICQQQNYLCNGQKIDLAAMLNLTRTRNYIPSNLNPQVDQRFSKTTYEVSQCDVIEAIHYMTPYVTTASEDQLFRIGVLNFASASNPGGGFLNGSLAQEEALAYCSSLYSQLKGNSLYSRPKRDGLYTTEIIYSRDVVFFRDSNYALLPVKSISVVDVATCPAVNYTHARKSHSEETVRTEMYNRIDFVLSSFVENGCDAIILGAYGCGVFGNSPAVVAGMFRTLLTTKYQGSFKYVLFAILGKEEFKPFDNAFYKLAK